ncbi:MAG: glycine betaine/L-proline ABC transporter ATP-binding protein [Alkalibacterium sp.]|uniref:Quaternary amine transport ATP-binding protein n=1 Tax=Alkalibacterium gilvum TaxID=1130080 RepID=A0A1H6THJ3_9LACT|nr:MULTISPECIES: glycine betaine/L-proline ABC transporter ATP-binding protein [Alkalibacterium]MDN6193637.1 glycine betaine/L-proline ABC transporter ATP-binding protein [Alkalibacterium sp.]MDN6293269.1 glycine betaine/L-proline ABC transporter ATP-binding protein [Alkalibacterium sp.]MDN6295031.1 glycine betaine/L-proline ABC transporter ATP-binding protein [Alkalibacterium sp.]MDN6326828.1 glycine betaine/L-proline ABC transporter ATP-binding protein [Alkalibacterium sp.]MDN6397530.1 glyci
MATKVEIQDLVKIFGKKEKQALELVKKGHSKEDILEKTGATVGVNKASFKVEEGEIFVIMGLSGSGKSTLVRMLNRLIEPTEGNILIDGDNVSKMSKEELRKVRREKVSMVFQNFGLFPHRTILENTEYGLEVQGVDKEVRQEKAEAALDNAGLLPYKDQKPNQLSGGMQQRVGLARALANDPEILLMDEAFSALDPLIRRDMQDELIQMQDAMQKTIIFITHDLNESLRIGDRIAIMKDGEVVQVGTGEEILTNPANEYVERFVEDVDRSKVLTAENIMIRPQTLRAQKQGPRVAAQQMKTEGLSSMLVIDNNQQLQGYVTDEDVLTAVKSGIKNFDSILRTDIPTVSKDTLVYDLYDIIHNTDTPVAVVDENNKLEGIVIRSLVIGALAKDREEESNNGE